MASGKKQLVVNSQERAVSTDINRLQSFAAAFDANFLQALMDTSCGSDDFQAGAVETIHSSLAAPAYAEIYSGLRVVPQNAALDLLVTPGAMGILDPDGAPDDSSYKRINDFGLLTPGTLLITPNSSGSTRIDVIECQDQSVVVETDNRDIFNPATGLFSAQTVTKAVQSNLQYRVRAGVPGNGFPGAVAGWVPLAVASVPTGTTTNDTITFWDVRPLVSSRIFQPFNMQRDMPLNQVYGRIDQNSTPGSSYLSGWCEANTPFSYTRLGGLIQRGTPGTDHPGAVDLQDPANLSAAITPGALCYVYLVEPFGLPNWARYTDPNPPAFRVPRSPRGIPVVSSVVPQHFFGAPSSPIALPTSTGLSGSTVNAVCIASAVAGPAGQQVENQSMDGNWTWLGTQIAAPAPAVVYSSGPPVGGAGTITVTWGLADGVTHSPVAKTLKISFTISLVLVPAAGPIIDVLVQPQFQVTDGAGNVVWETALFASYEGPYTEVFTDTNDLVQQIGGTIDIPLVNENFTASSGSLFQVSMNVLATNGTIAVGACKMAVVGFKHF